MSIYKSFPEIFEYVVYDKSIQVRTWGRKHIFEEYEFSVTFRLASGVEAEKLDLFYSLFHSSFSEFFIIH